MVKRTLIFIALLFCTSTLVGLSQNNIDAKLSVSTQLFLKELKGEISLDQPVIPDHRNAPGHKGENQPFLRSKHRGRLIAAPDTIDGRAYISAFIRLDNNKDVKALEKLGVEVQCKFENGLVTANIPVDKLLDVAALGRVRRISVAQLMRPFSDKARQATGVDAALTRSYDAIAAGLTRKYDGTGVLLGIIDSGIDFQHIAFKDKDGNSRITAAYVYDGNKAIEYVAGIPDDVTTDDQEEDHGTHTASTAGGSSVIIDGENTTVTDDHSIANYGGIAPGASLYLAGVKGFSDTYLANAIQKICNCGDAKGMPVVVSNSWGSQLGPHDGTGEFADIINQYFGDQHPNHICLFAASNDGNTGGFHVFGTSSSRSPLGTVINIKDDFILRYYSGVIASAWTRSTDVKELKCTVHIINPEGKVLNSASVVPTREGAELNLSEEYVYDGKLVAYLDYIESDKSQVLLYAKGGNYSPYFEFFQSENLLAVEISPLAQNVSTEMDIWSTSSDTYFSATPASPGHTWIQGSDDMCVSDEATFENVISVGAYITRNQLKDYNGNNKYLSAFPEVGDIAYFSSYATAERSPTHMAYPWITAPGATVISAVNHYDTSGSYSYLNGRSELYGMYRVNKDTRNPYGSMEGTSMATPVAAGIVALWLQASLEEGAVHKDLTVSKVKDIMRQTAIHDNFTAGTNASRFGYGKIDALAGLKYILGSQPLPALKAEPTVLQFDGYLHQTQKHVLKVEGSNLEGNIALSMSGSSAFAVHTSDITTIDGVTTMNLSVLWTPTEVGTQTGEITISAPDVESITISLTGNAEVASFTGLCPQVIWCERDATLYFTYSDINYLMADSYNGSPIDGCWIGPQQVCRSGKESETPLWANALMSDVPARARRVVFEPAFAKVRPVSTSHWFYNFTKLTEIVGIEYLNTGGVTNTSSMFEGCTSLQSINIDYFDTSRFTNASRMFAGCSSLSKIYCRLGWAHKPNDLTGIFDGCPKLNTSQTNWLLPFEGVFTSPGSEPFSGQGTQASPYLIQNATDWNHFVAMTNMGHEFEGKYFELTSDLSFADYFTTDDTNCNSTSVFSYSFRGHIDAKGHTISGIRWDRNKPGNPDHQKGLISSIISGSVRNLTVDDCIFCGKSSVAPIVGYMNKSSVENCHVTENCEVIVSVEDGFRSGGIVGSCWNSTIAGCTSGAKVWADVNVYQHLGGITGLGSTATIRDCLYTGERVDSYSSSHRSGAIAGYLELSTVENCFYSCHTLSIRDIGHDDADINNVGEAYLLTTTEGVSLNPPLVYKSYASFTNAPGLVLYTNFMMQYDGRFYAPVDTKISLTIDDSSIPDGEFKALGALSPDNQDYSFCINGNVLTMPSSDIILGFVPIWGASEGANGSADHPFLISNCLDLNQLSQRVNADNTFEGKYFKLVNDLDYKQGNFTTIGYYTGTQAFSFRGIFDGNGKKLRNMIIRDDQYPMVQGLFGSIGEGGMVKNLTLSRSSIYGQTLIGGIAATLNRGTVQDCDVEAFVYVKPIEEGPSYMGGIVGVNDGGSILGCTSSAEIGDKDLLAAGKVKGGIVGMNSADSGNPLVRDCIASGVKLYGTAAYGAIAGSSFPDGALVNNFYIFCSAEVSKDSVIVSGIGSNGIDTKGAVECCIHAVKPVGIGAEGENYPVTEITAFENGLRYRSYYLMRSLILGNDIDNSANIAYNNYRTLPIVTLKGRTLYKDGSWNTLCLPFDVTDRLDDDNITFTGTPLKGAIVKTLEDSEFEPTTGTLTLTFSENAVEEIHADTPYIVKWEEQGEPVSDPEFTKVVISHDYDLSIETPVVSFCGNYAPLTFTETDKTVLYLGDANTLYYPDPVDEASPVVFGAFRAHFKLDESIFAENPNGIKAFNLNFGEEETGIREISKESKTQGLVDDWYSLDGTRLLDKPTTKGLYIHNGRKVIF